jgi:hypothetical protein
VIQVIKKDLLLANPKEVQAEIIPEVSKLYIQMTQTKIKPISKPKPS